MTYENKLPNPTFCPDCENKDFRLFVKVTELGLLEIRCKDCGYGAVYSTEFLEK